MKDLLRHLITMVAIVIVVLAMQGCNTIDGLCDDTKMLNRAGQRAFKSYSDRQSGYYDSQEAELDRIVGK